MYLPPGHPIIAIRNNRNQNGRRIGKKVYFTVYLQGCLVSERCSASGLNCRYLNPYIKLKLIELAIKPYEEFLN